MHCQLKAQWNGEERFETPAKAFTKDDMLYKSLPRQEIFTSDLTRKILIDAIDKLV